MDRRQRKTRAAIFGAFTNLLQRKSYSSLTIQDIIDEADIGRTTFYAHFETKDELLRAICSDIFEHVFSHEILSEDKHDFTGHDSFRDRLTHILYHLKEKQQSISGLLSGECGEIFMRYFREYLYKVFPVIIACTTRSAALPKRCAGGCKVIATTRPRKSAGFTLPV